MLLQFLIFPVCIRIKSLRANEDIRDNFTGSESRGLGQSYRLNTCYYSISLMISKTDVSICDYEVLAKQSRYDLCSLSALPQKCVLFRNCNPLSSGSCVE